MTTFILKYPKMDIVIAIVLGIPLVIFSVFIFSVSIGSAIQYFADPNDESNKMKKEYFIAGAAICIMLILLIGACSN